MSPTDTLERPTNSGDGGPGDVTQGGGVAPTAIGLELDGIDDLVEYSRMLSVYAAKRYARIDAIRLAERARARSVGFPASLEMADRSVRLEIAAALHVGEGLVGRWMATAEALLHRFRPVWDGLHEARFSERHAEVIVETLDEISPHRAERVLPRAIALAEDLPLGAFRRRLRQLVDTEQAETLAERTQRALNERRVVVEPSRDGMAWLTAYIPAVEATAIHRRMTAMARTLTGPGEQRNLDQRRADVLCDLLIDGETDSLPIAARGIRPSVTVTVPALSLLGRTDAPAMVDGIGPIPLETARWLAGSADSWTRVLTHPETGVVLSVGRDRYRPPADLRRLVHWRSARCMAPGCSIPADRCDLDHTTDWAWDGQTSDENLAPLCRGHHSIKHHTNWSVTAVEGEPGVLEWRSPAGRTYRVEPERRIPKFVPAAEPPPGRSGDDRITSGMDPPPF